MNNIVTAQSSTDSNRTPAQARVRHGLIEDWRDALGILLLLLVAAFFGALITRMWPDGEDAAGRTNADLAARLTALETERAEGKSPALAAAMRDRITELEKRISRLETGVAGGTITASGTTQGSAAGTLPPTATDQSIRRVEDMSARLAALEARTATTPDDIKATRGAIDTLTATGTELKATVETVTARLVKLESSDLIVLARRASLAAAIANLTRAAQGSSPFANEYHVVAALLPENPNLTVIQPHAIKGIPTTGTLISTFGNRADAALDAEALAKGKTWSSQLLANFSSLISWRTTGDATGSSTESRLARAELRLKAGDLGAAVKEIGRIGGAARKPLEPWLNDAAARVRIEEALAVLNTEAVAAITQPAASPTPPAQPGTPPKAPAR